MKRTVLIVHLILLLLFIGEWAASIFLGENFTETWIKLLELETAAVYVFAFVVIVKMVGPTSVFMFYHVTFGMFLLSRFFADLMGFIPVEEIDTMVNRTIPPWALATTLEVFLVILLIQTPVYLFFSERIRLRPRKEARDEFEVRVAKVIFTIFTPLFFYRSFLEVKAVAETGYAAIYRGGLSEVLDLPLVLRISTTLMVAAFMVILKNRPPRREFLIFGGAFLAAQAADMLKGYRGMFMVTIVFLVWYHNKTYAQKLSFRRLVWFAPPLFLILLAIGSHRLDEVLDLSDLSGTILLFVVGTGSSMLVSSLFITYGVNMVNTSYPYILDPLLYLFHLIRHPELLWIGQSMEMLSIRNDFGHRITYFSNPEFYLAGHSIGTSYVAELLEFGVAGLILGSVILIAFTVLFEKATDRRTHVGFFVLYAYQFFYLIVYSPRNNFFPNSYIFLRDWIAIGSIVALGALFRGISGGAMRARASLAVRVEGNEAGAVSGRGTPQKVRAVE